MFRRFMIGMAAVVALSAMPLLAQNVDEIIASNVKAHGGLDKIKAAKTLRSTGKLNSGSFEAVISQEAKRPDFVRQEFTIQGLTAVQAYDGKTGWQIMPFGGKKDAELMGEDDLKEIQEAADFDGPLVDYKAKGNQVELVGKEPVEGTDAYKLKVTLKNGDVRFFYLDTDSFLEIKQESKKMVRGSERETETSIGDYKDVEGMMLPFSFEGGAKGSPNKQKVTIDKYEVNAPVDDSRFKMPPKPAATEEKKEEKKPEPKKSEEIKK